MEENKSKIKKRVLIFSLAFHPFVGGAEVAVKEITDRISDIDFDMVTLRFDSDLPKFEKIGNVNIHRIGFSKRNPSTIDMLGFPLKLNKIFFPFSALLKAIKLHRKNNYDATWSIMANYAGFAALFFKMVYPKTPYLLTLQEGDPIEYIKKKVRLVYFLFERIFIKANFIQVISNYLGGWAHDMGFKGGVLVIPNGVDLNIFLKEFSQKDLDLTKDLLIKKYGAEKTDKFIITTSRLVEKNAVGDIISSLKYLPSNIKLLIAGEGYLKDTLERQIEEEHLNGRVIFLGSLLYKDIPKYLKISEVFVRPSLSEGMGNSFVEAMVSGIPVVATSVGGIVDFIKDGNTGLFCEVKNPKSIADKVKIFLEDENLRNEIIKNGKELAIAKYDWEVIAKDMKEKVFYEILYKNS